MQQFKDKIPGGEHIIQDDPTEVEMIRAQGKISGFSPNSPSSSEKIWGYDTGSGGNGAREMLGMGESARRPIENILGSSSGQSTNIDNFFNTGKKKSGNLNQYLSMGKKKNVNMNQYLSMGKKTNGTKMNVDKFFNMGKKKSVNMNQYLSMGKKTQPNMMNNKISNMLGGQGKTNNAVHKILGVQGTGNKINNMLGQSNINNKINNMLGGQGTGNKINDMLGIKSDAQSKDKFLEKVGNFMGGRGFQDNPNVEASNQFSYEDPNAAYYMNPKKKGLSHQFSYEDSNVADSKINLVDSKEEVIQEEKRPGAISSMFGTVKGWAEEAHAEKLAEREKRSAYQDTLNRQLGEATVRKFQPKQYVLSEKGNRYEVDEGLVNIKGKFFPLNAETMNEDGTYSFGKMDEKFKLSSERGKAAGSITKLESDYLGLELRGGKFQPKRTDITGTATWGALTQGAKGIVGLADKVTTNAPGTIEKLSKTLYGDVAQQDFSKVVNMATGKSVQQRVPMITEVKKDKKGNIITTTKPLLRGRPGTQGYGAYGGMEGTYGDYGAASPAAEWQKKVQTAVPMGGSARSLDFYSQHGRAATGSGLSEMTPQFSGSGYGGMVMGLQNKEMPQPVQESIEQTQYQEQVEQPQYQQPVPQQPMQPVQQELISQPVAQAPTEYRTEGTIYTPQALKKQVTYRRGPYKKRKFIVTTPNVPVTVSAQTVAQPNMPQRTVTYDAPVQQQEETYPQEPEPISNIERTKQIIGF